MDIIGLDISSSKVGIAVLGSDDSIKVSEVLKFKSNMALEERAEIFAQRMEELEKHYVPIAVYVEQPALMFKGGKTTAQTMAKLQRFNGMCSYIIYSVFDSAPILVNPRSARRVLGIKIAKGENAKKRIVEWVKREYAEDFQFKITRHGTPHPGTDDRADAIITALGGVRLDNEA